MQWKFLNRKTVRIEIYRGKSFKQRFAVWTGIKKKCISRSLLVVLSHGIRETNWLKMAISIHYGDRDNGVMRIGASSSVLVIRSPPRSVAPPYLPRLLLTMTCIRMEAAVLNRTIGYQDFLIEWDGSTSRNSMDVDYIFIFCLLAFGSMNEKNGTEVEKIKKRKWYKYLKANVGALGGRRFTVHRRRRHKKIIIWTNYNVVFEVRRPESRIHPVTNARRSLVCWNKTW